MHLAAPEGVPRKRFLFRSDDNLDQQDLGKLKNCSMRHGQLKKCCVKDTSRNITDEMKRDITL